MVKVISAEPAKGYKLRIRLSNGKNGLFDVSPYLDKGVFHELKDPQYLRRVKVAFGGIMWPHEQDFSAESGAETIDSKISSCYSHLKEAISWCVEKNNMLSKY
ncbi:MAG TPA: DUF2442 domain-containing protein [Nitrospiraceae bacterium]|nr:MAG: hypothetical protein A3D21_08095 [Nitrospirae bacterium RIFCSPHIGHO2_02_FULL_42_12]HBI24843.1 DUF2442 domain-containing protein [Nitrospiraceae bacterium]HKZ56185.1 DUF2442 domain-containing protein [Thermodesulfovibrionales bacterium]